MFTRSVFLLGLCCSSTLVAAAPISFQDQSKAAGLDGYVESWGLTWTDINGDRRPDLFIQGHRDYPQVYRNTGRGTFEDVANEYDPNQIWMKKTYEDKHAATSADVDNDGDQDMLIAVSGSGPAQLLMNRQESGGKYVEQARSANLDYDETARMAIWFDYNNDGLLDVHQISSGGSTLMKRSSWRFRYSLDDLNRCSGHGDYGQLTDVNNDGHLDYICGRQGVFPQQIYDYSRGYFSSFYRLNNRVPEVGNVIDSVTGDFNNDLKSDFILMRGALRGSGAARVSDHGIDGWMRGGSSTGFSFTAEGQVTFTVDHDPMGVETESKVVVLDTNGPTSASPGGVRISYSSRTGEWTVTRGSPDQAYVQARSESLISEPELIDIKSGELPTPVFHLVNGDSGFSIDHTTGISRAKSCVSGVAADFDNDMDLDVYMACRQGVNNLANRYFDNQGDGTFVEVLSHGGEGPVGAGLEYGVAESVAVADYDVDGFMDVAATNGLLYYPVGSGGPYSLLRNKGNSNKWIEIDLEGVSSNRDGVGAMVYATAGGVTQLREQNGGYHRWSQNSQRIHFGLASNNTVDITIKWPSGEVDTHSNVPANALYQATEGGNISPVTLGPEEQTVVNPGDECGEPVYTKTYGPAITMWKDCGRSNEWRLRFYSGNHSAYPLASTGAIYGDDAFQYANGVSLAGDDILFINSGNALSFDIAVQNKVKSEKGINLYTGSQTTSCLDFTNQDIPNIIVGDSHKRIKAPFDLIKLSTCEPDSSGGGNNGGGNGGGGSISDSCYEPDYDSKTEQGVFIWNSCDGSDEWHLRVTGGGDSSGVSYTGHIQSDGGINYSGYSIEPSDVIDTSDPDALEYLLKVWNNAQDGIDFVATENACFSSTTNGLPVYLGRSRKALTNPVNLTTLEQCVGQVIPPQCGEPSYDNKSEPGLYVWQDCSADDANESWYIRAVAGGLNWAPYSGLLSASEFVVASGNQLETNDIVDSVPNDNEVDFTLYVGNGGVDGVDVQFPTTSDTCLDILDLPFGSQVYVGENKQPVEGPFNLSDLGACQ